MKKSISCLNKAFAILLFVFSAAFFLYGIYMITYAVGYTHEYDSTARFIDAARYVISSSASYFGFGLTLSAAAMCLINISMLAGKKETRKDSETLCEQIRQQTSDEPSEHNAENIIEDHIVEEKPEEIILPVSEPELNAESDTAGISEENHEIDDIPEESAEITQTAESDVPEPAEIELDFILEEIEKSEQDDEISLEETAPQTTESTAETTSENETYDDTDSDSQDEKENVDKPVEEHVTYHERISSSMIKDIFESK